jgi:hypothetical protein
MPSVILVEKESGGFPPYFHKEFGTITFAFHVVKVQMSHEECFILV